MLKAGAEDAFDPGGGLQQQVPEPVRGARVIVGEVFVVAAEDPQLLLPMSNGKCRSVIIESCRSAKGLVRA